MKNKLTHVILSAAIILISLGVTVVKANPTSLRSMAPGLVLIAVGIALAVIWKSYFKEEIAKELRERGA